MTKWQIFVEYVLKKQSHLAAVLLQHLPSMWCASVSIGGRRSAFQLEAFKEVAIQALPCLKSGRWSARCCGVGCRIWRNGRRALVACIALALIIATTGVYQHASNQYVYLMSLFALGLSGLWPAC